MASISYEYAARETDPALPRYGTGRFKVRRPDFGAKQSAPQLSQEFFKTVKIVLDRSQFNRIISHITNSKGFWSCLLVLRVQCWDGAFGFRYTVLILSLPANAPPE